MRLGDTAFGVVRSLTAKLVAVIIVLVLVPVLIYGLLEKVDAQKNQLVLRTVQQQGELIAEALAPHLENFSPTAAERMRDLLPTLAPEGGTIKVLFRPQGTERPEGFLYVAGHPRIEGDNLIRERREIVETGLLEQISLACESAGPLAVPFRSPLGHDEVLTYLGTHASSKGCWAVIASIERREIVGAAANYPYWQTREISIAVGIYLVMALTILSIFVALHANMRGFRGVIRAIRAGHGDHVSFRQRNRIPELSSVAGEFDELVGALRHSESLIRQTAAENAHALKAPLAVMSQSVEPLRQAIGSEDSPSGRSLKRIEDSVARLDGLITAAREIDETTAALIDRPPETLDLKPLLTTVADAYRLRGEARAIRIATEFGDGLAVTANDDLLETAIENVIGNALDFAPDGSLVAITAACEGRERVRIQIADQGPGIPEHDLDQVFDRYFSTRRGEPGSGNFGIGLWIARRNLEAMGGEIHAANNLDAGLTVSILLRRSM